ncbi:MAG: cysteine-rich CWC family protein, partial [Psychromonas sp.]
TCPLCLQDNSCDVKAKKGCWCSQIEVPAGLLDLLDDNMKNKQCICHVCISRFNADPNSVNKSVLPTKPDLSYKVY